MASLFDAAAERIARETGRAKSQVAAELVAPIPAPVDFGLFADRAPDGAEE